MRKTLTASLVLALTVSPAAAQSITPVGVTATSTLGTGFYSPSSLINGNGLSGGLHNGDFSAMWVSELGVNQAQVMFDLGTTYALGGADIWNYNWGNPAQFQSTILRGVRDFRILTSLDGTSFGEVYAGRLALGTGEPLAAQTVTFGGTARFVQIDILNNYALGTYAERDWNSGLSEVRFLQAAAAVPEPGTWAMMLLGFAGIGASLRRRRHGGNLSQLA